MRMTLTKHHGLGNDFLVVFDDQPLARIAWEAMARRLCDRRTGIGADGLIVGLTRAEGADLGMALFNADGSRAEMSGNGIRCLAQAWAEKHGMQSGIVKIATDAGLREVEILPDRPDSRSITATVSMGEVADGQPPPGWDALGLHPDRPVVHVNLGNPHAVVAVDDVNEVDLAAAGTKVPDVNLEIVEAGPEPDAITMRVHERGAGITLACGTGACAAAHAAVVWGLVPRGTREITVHMDGGDARVRLSDPAHPGEAVLVGPATFIANIEVA
jgi:diaminopimelate epimerase